MVNLMLKEKPRLAIPGPSFYNCPNRLRADAYGLKYAGDGVLTVLSSVLRLMKEG
jgi:hypothetical protein